MRRRGTTDRGREVPGRPWPVRQRRIVVGYSDVSTPIGGRTLACVAQRRHKHLVLILAREVASNLATPTLIADDQGQLVFYNEAAEEIIGRRFAETGEMPIDEFTALFAPRTRDSEDALPPERRPARIALDERRAAHEQFRITSLDGAERNVAVTAFPLFAHADEFIGIVAIFWRE
jgi:PAS domain-containing protein